MLGTPGLFATAYGNVGSSIYYALGLTAAYALGLTPLVFVIAGVIFAATAATYAEGTARFPEAGGSASFARHAFDELVSFVAAWAQMLVYVVTVAVSAFFVPHYLSIFWEPLRTNPWDIVGGAIVIVVLVALNVVGVQEAAKLSITLAVVDFATQLLLVIIGFALVFNPEILTSNVHWGVAPTWENLAVAIPVAMLAYTGVETVSNLAEEARDPVRTVPNAYKAVAVAVFAIYFTLPFVALSALPVERIDGELTTRLALPPEEGGYANDPILGVVQNLGIDEGWLLDGMEIYVGVLAATILFIATNAGVIGASRITYSMASYRQMPEVFRRLHPRLKTPWLSLVVFAGIAPILVILPGDVNFVGTLYSLGRDALLHRRPRLDRPHADAASTPARRLRTGRGRTCAWRESTGRSSPSSEESRRASRSSSSSCRTRRRAGSGSAGSRSGSPGTRSTARRVVRAPLRETVKAPPAFGAALALEYRRLLVPVVGGQPSDAAMDLACRLAAERGVAHRRAQRARGSARSPADGRAPGARARGEPRARPGCRGRRLLRRPRAHAARAGSLRGNGDRERGGCAELGDHRARLAAPLLDRVRQAAVFGKTVDYVLKHAPCRVLVAASEAP